MPLISKYELVGKSINYSEFPDNKPTYNLDETLFLKRFESRMFDACEYNLLLLSSRKLGLRLKPIAPQIKIINDTVDVLKKLTENLEQLGRTDINFCLANNSSHKPNLQSLAGDITKALDRIKVNKPAVGRPMVTGDLAFLILSANESIKEYAPNSRRRLLNGIGRIIEPNGKLNSKLDSIFGKGAFDKLHLPVPNFTDSRWERTCLKPLEYAAFKYFTKKYPPFSPSAKDLIRVKEFFKSYLKLGGYTEFELELRQQEISDHLPNQDEYQD